MVFNNFPGQQFAPKLVHPPFLCILVQKNLISKLVHQEISRFPTFRGRRAFTQGLALQQAVMCPGLVATRAVAHEDPGENHWIHSSMWRMFHLQKEILEHPVFF